MARHEANEGNEVKEIIVVQTPDSTQEALQRELGELLGLPDAHQKKILANLARLHHSLRGPENALDKGNYSRPFPEMGKPTQTTGTSTSSQKR